MRYSTRIWKRCPCPPPSRAWRDERSGTKCGLPEADVRETSGSLTLLSQMKGEEENLGEQHSLPSRIACVQLRADVLEVEAETLSDRLEQLATELGDGVADFLGLLPPCR
jgi:hypothetical protein